MKIGIDITRILPMNIANVSHHIGGSFPRARSFLVEPTDFALCLNTIFPIILFKAKEDGKKKSSILFFSYIFSHFYQRKVQQESGL